MPSCTEVSKLPNFGGNARMHSQYVPGTSRGWVQGYLILLFEQRKLVDVQEYMDVQEYIHVIHFNNTLVML